MPAPEQAFAGDKKVPLKSPLAAIEKKFIERSVASFPPGSRPGT